MAKSLLDISSCSLPSRSSRNILRGNYGDGRKKRYRRKRMSNKFPFTQLVLEKLTVPAGKSKARFYDERLPGLMLEVAASGHKTFWLRKTVDYKDQWARIGRFPEVTLDQARTMAMELNVRAAKGENFKQTRQDNREELTLAELADFYFDQYAANRCRTAPVMKQDFNRWFATELPIKLSKIDTYLIQVRINKLASDGHIHRANKALNLIRAILNWALRKGFCQANPATKVDNFKVQSRERFIQPDEFPKLLMSINDYPDERIRDFLHLCLYTGARCGKILSMRWEDINLQLGTWLIATGKNGESQTISLSDAALEVLERRYRNRGLIPWVLPGGRSARRPTTEHLAEPKKAWAIIRNKAGLTDLRIHDLRRTLASFMVITGASTPIIQKQLGHKSMAAAAIYQRVNNQPVKIAADQAIKVMRQLAEETAKTKITSISIMEQS